MREFLRQIIIWALGGSPVIVNDAAGMDKIASEKLTS
jgi:hypothetical protein